MSEAKACPLAVHPVTGRLDCVKDRCAIWSEYFAMCSFAVKAYMLAIENHRKETLAWKHDR